MRDLDIAIDNSTTPLILAVTTGRGDVVQELLRRGADPNRCEPGAPWLTPLYEALKRGDSKIVHALVLAGANPDFVDENGLGLDIRSELAPPMASLLDRIHSSFSRMGGVFMTYGK